MKNVIISASNKGLWRERGDEGRELHQAAVTRVLQAGVVRLRALERCLGCFFFVSFSIIRNLRRRKGERCPSCCVDSSRVERWWSTRSLWARCVDPSQHRLLSRCLGNVLTASSWWVYASSCLQRRNRCFVHSCNCRMEEIFLPRVPWARCGKYNCRFRDQHLKVQPKNKILW